MSPLAVDPGALDRAGADVVVAGESLGSVVFTLTMALLGCAGMAGDDPAGTTLGGSYDGSAAKLVGAMVATRNGLCNLGAGVRMSAHNYSLAEARSDIGGQSNPLPAPQLIEPLVAGSPPSSVGAGDGAPPGWGWVAPFIGMIWPTANPAKLRTAAAAWSDAGTKFALTEIQETAGPMGAVRAQQIPEGPAIDAAFSDTYASTTSIVAQCQTIAAQLSSYAAKVDQVHAAILDLLARICDPLTGIKEVWDVLTDKDEDEIKKIADDIRTVVDNFIAEVDALRARIAAVLEQATTVVTAMGDYAVTHWDPFSHALGHAFNQLGQRYKGIGEEAGGLLKGLWEVSQLRAVTDPQGWFNSLGEVSGGIAPLIGAGGGHGPAIGQAWQQLGKDLTHWDEWKSNPLEAYGKTEVDLATMFLPGGPVSKLDKMGTAARDVLDLGKGLRKPPTLEPLKPPPVEPPKPPPAKPGPTPRALPPEFAAQTKPAPAAPGTPAPHSPTESKPPVPHEPGAGPAPQPKGAPPTPAGPRPGPAPIAPSNDPPPLHPRPTEPVPARATESSAHSGEPGGYSHDPGLQSLESAPEYPEYPDAERRTTISGHGAYDPADGHLTVPRGTTITLYAEHGSTITDDLGNLIETGGDTSMVYSRTFHPGEQIPNYTIYPPDGLNIMGTPQTVLNPTRLTELINEEMGRVDLAICPYDETCPTGMIYDVDGIFNQWTGVYEPYGSDGFDSAE
jgi:hypothetical protein